MSWRYPRSSVIASHSNSKALCSHRRNLTDDQARAIAQKGGVIGVNFAGHFLGEGRRSLAGVVDHIDHFSSIIGPEYIALGSDFDGLPWEQLPDELKDVSQLPKVAEELAARGYSESAIQGIMGENLLRQRISHRLELFGTSCSKRPVVWHFGCRWHCLCRFI